MNKALLNTKLYLDETFKHYWQGQDPFLAANKLNGKVYRALEQRKTLSFQIEEKSYFAKIHKSVQWKEIFKNLMQLRLPVISAKNEWVALHYLQSLNITTLTPVAYGRRGWLPSTIESFLVTKDVGPNQSLEDVCGNWKKKKPSYAFKTALIEEVAVAAKLMHENGICHRDFYICHFLLSSNGGLTLIDLHRALVKKNLSQRWVIKDIGALYFSVNHIALSRSDIYRFMKVYSGKSLRKTLLEDKTFWMNVTRRATNINKGKLIVTV